MRGLWTYWSVIAGPLFRRSSTCRPSASASFFLFSSSPFQMSFLPHRAVCVRLHKNREPNLDDLCVPIAVASSPFGHGAVSVVIEEPAASPSQTPERTALVTSLAEQPLPPTATGHSLFSSDRLAGLVWLCNIYRTSNVFTPSQIQLLGNYIIQASHDQLSLIIANSSSDGRRFLISLLKSVLPDIQSVPVATPNLPIFSASGLVCSLISLSASQLSAISLALTLEASRSPLTSITSAAFSLHPEVSRAANRIQWLLDESKLARQSQCDQQILSLLSQSVSSLASFEDAAAACVSTCRTELKQSLKISHSTSSSGTTHVSTVPRITLIFATLKALQDTLSRCQLVLVPLLTSRAESNKARRVEAWPEDRPVPPDVVVPDTARPVNEHSINELTSELHVLENSLSGCFATFPGSMTVEAINSYMIKLSESIVQSAILEMSMALALLQDDQVDSYNSAVAKTLKNKKNVTSKLHYGRALQRFESEIMNEWKSESSLRHLASFHKALSFRCEQGGILSLQQLLSDVVTPLNQGSRRPKVAKGTLDTDPKRMVIREHVFELIKSVFGRYGAVAIDTPVFELRETLMGKYGEDQKLIFDLKDQGGEQLSLRYDLTVPFARWCATQSIEKIKRFHIGKVYRRDEPQMARGRFREFYQCDFDIAGDYDVMVPDAEVLGALVDILRLLVNAVGPFEVKLNHRKLLDAIMVLCGVPKESFRPVCSAIDKLDKMSWEDVKREMCETKGLRPEVADRIYQFVSMKGKPVEMLQKLEKMEDLTKLVESQKCLSELKILFRYLNASGIDSDIVFDLSLARGLDYYTGVIFEAVLTSGQDVGSVAAGGRYDKLVGMFSGRDIPAVGVSIGVERLFRIIEKNLGILEVSAEEGENVPGKKKKQDEPQLINDKTHAHLREHQIDVFVCSVGDEMLCERIKICRKLRDAGIAADFYYGSKAKLGKQMTCANEQGVPLAVIFGEDELRTGIVKLRKFKYGESDEASTGKEAEVALGSLADEVKSILSSSKSNKEQTLALITSSRKANKKD